MTTRFIAISLTSIVCGLLIVTGFLLVYNSQRHKTRVFNANLSRVAIIATGTCDPKMWELVVKERISSPEIVSQILKTIKDNGPRKVSGLMSGIQGPYVLLEANGDPVYWTWYYPEQGYLQLMSAERDGERYRAVLAEENGVITVVDFPNFTGTMRRALTTAVRP